MTSFFSIFFFQTLIPLYLSLLSFHPLTFAATLSLSLFASLLTLSRSLLLCSLSHALHFSAYSLTLFASLLGMFTHSQLSFLFLFFFCWIILCMHIESQIILSLYFLFFFKICSASLPRQIKKILDLLCQIGKSVVCLSVSSFFI